MIDSPYREITRPILKYVRDYPRTGPRDIITVIIPEYVVGHWWEQILHNQTALRLKSRLLFQPGVVVIDIPWHLQSANVDDTAVTTPAAGEQRNPGCSRPPTMGHSVQTPTTAKPG